jgi:hypothetical protein
VLGELIDIALVVEEVGEDRGLRPRVVIERDPGDLVTERVDEARSLLRDGSPDMVDGLA